jgi:hypothetical protein
MPLIYRENLNRALTWEEADGNLQYLSTTMSGSAITITGSTIVISGSTTFEGNVNFNTSSFSLGYIFTVSGSTVIIS